MKNRASPWIAYLVFLALLLHGTPGGNSFARLHQSDKYKMSPESWPPGELEKYSQLQQKYNSPTPAAECN